MDHQDEFQNWCDLWDQAQNKGIFPEQPPLQPISSFGIDDAQADDAASQYYNHLDQMDELLREDDHTTPNPVFPDSIGKDQDVPRLPRVSQKNLQTVAELKQQLYDLECRLNAQDAGGSRWHESPIDRSSDRAREKLASLQRRLDTLSDKLGIEDEPPQSLWKVRSK